MAKSEMRTRAQCAARPSTSLSVAALRAESAPTLVRLRSSLLDAKSKVEGTGKYAYTLEGTHSAVAVLRWTCRRPVFATHACRYREFFGGSWNASAHCTPNALNTASFGSA